MLVFTVEYVGDAYAGSTFSFFEGGGEEIISALDDIGVTGCTESVCTALSNCVVEYNGDDVDEKGVGLDGSVVVALVPTVGVVVDGAEVDIRVNEFDDACREEYADVYIYIHIYIHIYIYVCIIYMYIFMHACIRTLFYMLRV